MVRIFKPLLIPIFSEKKIKVPRILVIHVTLLKHIYYFQKRIDPNTPGCRGLYFRNHVSCQAVQIIPFLILFL